MRSYSADETYTLADLAHWDFPGPSLAVLGHPVRHSISPQMHNAALASLSRERSELADWRYFRFDVPPEQLVEALPRFHAKGFAGLNLTVPHKEIAFAALEQIDERAQRIGAVNTLARHDSGYRGYNTDGYGLLQGVRETLGREIANSDIALLGAGGAARAAAILCLEQGCRQLVVVNRNQERLARLIAELKEIVGDSPIPLRGIEPSAARDLPPGCLLINATSLGLKTDDPTPIPEENLPDASSCFDMIYNPPATKLMALAERKGGKSANGLSMLVHQGAKSLEIWTRATPPVSVMRQAAQAALASHRP